MGCVVHHYSRNIFDKPSIVAESSSDNSMKLPNPDPYNFEIVDSIRDGRFLIVKVNYPDCKNYEGNKILVYENVNLNKLRLQAALDPHFSNNTELYSPIARFEPTDRGWIMAQIFTGAC